MKIKLNIYEIDDNYILYLKTFNKNIHNIYGINDRIYIQTVKYIGKFDFLLPTFAPLSSDKNKLHINDNNDNFVPIWEKGEYLGVIRICNQIPLPTNIILYKAVNINEYINSNDIKKNKYGRLLKKEYNFINNPNECKKIFDKSFNVSMNNKEYQILVEAAKIYDPNNIKIINRIKSNRTYSYNDNINFIKEIKRKK